MDETMTRISNLGVWDIKGGPEGSNERDTWAHWTPEYAHDVVVAELSMSWID